MGTKIAAFNIENFFDRAAAFNEATDDAQSIIGSVAKLNELFERPRYDSRTKSAILALVNQLGLNRFLENEFMRIRKIRGSILRFPRGGSPPTVIAEGRDDWVGWAEHGDFQGTCPIKLCAV